MVKTPHQTRVLNHGLQKSTDASTWRLGRQKARGHGIQNHHSGFQTVYTPQVLDRSVGSVFLKHISQWLALWLCSSTLLHLERSCEILLPLKVQAHFHLHEALCSSPLKVRFQGVWSPLCPSPICSAPLSVLCILKTTLYELDQWTPTPPGFQRAAQGRGREETDGDGAGVSRGAPFPAPPLQHHGGQAIMVGEFPSEELHCLSIDCLHTTAPPPPLAPSGQGWSLHISCY